MEAEGYPTSILTARGGEGRLERILILGNFRGRQAKPKGRDSSDLLRILLQKLICKYFFGISWIPSLPSYRRITIWSK